MKQQPFEAPYEQIRAQIQRAHAERAVHLAETISEGIAGVARGLSRVSSSVLGWPGRTQPVRAPLAAR